MIKKRKNNNLISKILYSQIFLAFLGLILIILICIPLIKNLNKRNRVDKEIKKIENEISELELENKDFKKLISYLESEEFVEEQARLNLGLKKQGEKVVVIQNNKDLAKININDINEEKIIKSLNSNFNKWVKYFLK